MFRLNLTAFYTIQGEKVRKDIFLLHVSGLNTLRNPCIISVQLIPSRRETSTRVFCSRATLSSFLRRGQWKMQVSETWLSIFVSNHLSLLLQDDIPEHVWSQNRVVCPKAREILFQCHPVSEQLWRKPAGRLLSVITGQWVIFSLWDQYQPIFFQWYLWFPFCLGRSMILTILWFWGSPWLNPFPENPVLQKNAREILWSFLDGLCLDWHTYCQANMREWGWE